MHRCHGRKRCIAIAQVHHAIIRQNVGFAIAIEVGNEQIVFTGMSRRMKERIFWACASRKKVTNYRRGERDDENAISSS